MLNGRDLVIATMHKKEIVIAPILEKGLGVKCIIPESFNTDELGTFTGEVKRIGSPFETAKKKCHLAMNLTGCDLVISSEGSFAAHPSLIFIPANEEILLLIDKKNNLEIGVKEISTETNFNAREVATEQELIEFAQLTMFPSHGLIIMDSKECAGNIVKGIQDLELLLNTFKKFITNNKTVYVETDMRAFCNPSRMKVIETATIKLVEKYKSACPRCQTPGFGITDLREGLPCSLCGFKTRSILSQISECKKCSYIKEELYPKGKKEEDPMYCDFCNP